MNLKAPTVKNEINLNSIIMMLGLAVLLVGWGITWGVTTRDLTATTKDVEEVKLEAKHNASTAAGNKSAIDRLEYRIGQQEKGAVDLAKSVDELKKSLNAQGADVRVIREILTRIDRQNVGGQ